MFLIFGFVIAGLLMYILDLEILLGRIANDHKRSPTAYICKDDYDYELDPSIKNSTVKIYNNPANAKADMGEVHVRQSGIWKVKLINVEEVVKGGEYRKEDFNE